MLLPDAKVGFIPNYVFDLMSRVPRHKELYQAQRHNFIVAYSERKMKNPAAKTAGYLNVWNYFGNHRPGYLPA